jgi:hypothetical protein
MTSDDGRETCPRCGFTVNPAGASEGGAARLREALADHVAVCRTLPSSTEVRDLRRRVRKERFLHGEDAARNALEDGLAVIWRRVPVDPDVGAPGIAATTRVIRGAVSEAVRERLDAEYRAEFRARIAPVLRAEPTEDP